MASFVPAASAWIADAGVYTLEAAASSLDVRQQINFTLPDTLMVEKVHNVLHPPYEIKELKR